MRLIVFGQHGSGKGTQAKLISEHYRIPVICTGDIIRDNIRKNTELGRQMKKYIDQHKYVPDKIMDLVIEEEVNRDASRNGFVLDGYPRTIEQAEFLDDLMSKSKLKLDIVINIVVDEKELVGRLLKRGRQDDTKEGIQGRMKEYKLKATSVLNYYKKNSRVVDINGGQAVGKVFKDIKSVLDKLSG